MCPRSFKQVAPASQLGTGLHGGGVVSHPPGSLAWPFPWLTLGWGFCLPSHTGHRVNGVALLISSLTAPLFCTFQGSCHPFVAFWVFLSLSFLFLWLFFTRSVFSPPSYSIVLFDLKCKSDWVWCLTKILLKIHLTWVRNTLKND